MGGATGVEGRAWLLAACLVVRKSFSQELRIRWEGKRREYCRGGVLCVCACVRVHVCMCVCVCACMMYVQWKVCVCVCVHVWICMMCAQWKVCVCV